VVVAKKRPPTGTFFLTTTINAKTVPGVLNSGVKPQIDQKNDQIVFII
jgi:hypothetical protein